jgi:hypothetical protein
MPNARTNARLTYTAGAYGALRIADNKKSFASLPPNRIDCSRAERRALNRIMLRLIVRAFAVLLITVGLSVGLAWAWDHSDAPKAAQQHNG